MMRVIALLAILAALAWYFGFVPSRLTAPFAGVPSLAPASITTAPPATLYKWKDASGQVVYGNNVPAGVKAERLSGERGSVNVVQATRVPPPEASKPSADAQSIRDKAMDRAIDGASQ